MGAYSTLSALSNDSTLTNGAVITHTEHNTHRTNYRALINDLLTAATEQEKNRAGAAEPTDKAEGIIYCDTTNDPAQLKFYKDGAANLFTLASLEALNVFTVNQTFSAKIICDDVTDATSITTGSIQTDGGLGVAKQLHVGTSTILNGSLTLQGAAPTHFMSETDAGVDQGLWRWAADGENLRLELSDDAKVNFKDVFRIQRSGTGAGITVDSFIFGGDITVPAASNLLLNGATAPTSLAGGIAMVNGTAASAALTDGISMWAADWNGAGTAALHMFDEEGFNGPIPKVTSGEALNCKIIDIGDWDMDATLNVDVAHGLTATKIRHISVMIRNDANTFIQPLDRMSTSNPGVMLGSATAVDGTNIRLFRTDTSVSGSTVFDGTNYNSTSFNRGWIMIWYTN